MRHTGRHVGRYAAWLLAVLFALTPAASRAAEPPQAQWQLATFTWVKRVPAEPGAPSNTHPAPVSPEALRSLLAPVQVRVDRKDVPLFSRDELKELTPVLGEALALAQPGEGLILLSTCRHGGGFMDPTEGLTARLFVKDGALNLLVHDARLEFLVAYQAMNVPPTFVYGSRAKASAEVLSAPGATRLRPDWLALPLAAATTPVAAPAPVAAAPALPQPAPKVAAPAAPEAATDEAVMKRLRTLQRLRDANLITEAEYRERREAILKAL
jgi:hypothetical protein